MLFLRSCARNQELELSPALAQQRRRLQHAAEVFLLIQAAGKQQRGRCGKMKRLSRARAGLRVRLLLLGAGVKHFYIAFEPAFVEKRTRFFIGDPDFVAAIEKIEREILGELLLLLVKRVLAGNRRKGGAQDVPPQDEGGEL